MQDDRDERQFSKPSFASPPWAKPQQTPELKPTQGARKTEEQEIEELSQQLKAWGKELKNQNKFFSLVPDKMIDLIADQLAKPLVQNGFTADKMKGHEDQLSDLFNFSARAMNRPLPNNDPRREEEEKKLELLLELLIRCIMEAKKQQKQENKFDEKASAQFDQDDKDEKLDPQEKAKMDGAIAVFKDLQALKKGTPRPTPANARRGKQQTQPSAQSDQTQSDTAEQVSSFTDELGEDFLASTSSKNGRNLSLRMVNVQFVPGGDEDAQAQAEINLEGRGGKHTAQGDAAVHHTHDAKSSDSHQFKSPFAIKTPKPPGFE